MVRMAIFEAVFVVLNCSCYSHGLQNTKYHSELMKGCEDRAGKSSVAFGGNLCQKSKEKSGNAGLGWRGILI